MWHSTWNTDFIPIQDAKAANLALGNGQDERFFNKLEDDVSRIIQQEKRREQYTSSQGQEVNTSTEHEPVSGQTTNTPVLIFFYVNTDDLKISVCTFCSVWVNATSFK